MTVADKLDDVVDIDVGGVRAAVEDTALVEGPCAGIYIDSQRADLGNGGHDRVNVVGVDNNIRSKGSNVLGASGGCAHTGGAVEAVIAPLPGLCDATILNDVLVCELSGGALAAAGTAAVVGVGGAGSDLLLGENEKLAGVDGVVALKSLGGAVGPAGTAVTLVLDSSNDGRESAAPVNAAGESNVLSSGGGNLHVGEVLSLEAMLGLGNTTVEAAALSDGPVGHVVNVHGVALGRVGVVRTNNLEVLVEGGFASLALGLARVGLTEGDDVVIEGISVEIGGVRGLAGDGGA